VVVEVGVLVLVGVDVIVGVWVLLGVIEGVGVLDGVGVGVTEDGVGDGSAGGNSPSSTNETENSNDSEI